MKKNLKVMVFGTFDLLHPGHLNFLMQAKELGNKLIVSVARDVNVFKIKSQRTVQDEKLRLQNVSLLPIVDKAVLGGLKDPWPHIKKEKPDIIALGYDQEDYIEDLRFELPKHGLTKTQIVRLKAHWPQVYKSKIIRKNLEQGDQS